MDKDFIVDQGALARVMQAQSKLPVKATLPVWAKDARDRFTLMGLLYVRVQRLIGDELEGTMVKGRFAVGRVDRHVAFVEAYEAVNEGQPSIAVFVMARDTPMILHDDPLLFPSDALVIKISMLRDAALKE